MQTTLDAAHHPAHRRKAALVAPHCQRTLQPASVPAAAATTENCDAQWAPRHRGATIWAGLRTLLIDNYDSYTFNLFHLLGEVGGDEPVVVRNDELPWEELAAMGPDNVVISPGPGRPEHPRDVGVSLDALNSAEVPVLGVCLGHQALAHVTGGAVEHAPEVMHGRLSPIHHDERALFAGIPQGFLAVRYHSLVVGAVPAELRVTARTPDGVIMGLEHRTRPLFGVQFHPESVSTRHGRRILENFRDITRVRRPAARRGPARRRRPARPAPQPAPAAASRVHHLRLESWCEPEAVFTALYAERDHAIWLDSATPGPIPARFSFVGAPDGPLGEVVRYDVETRTLAVDRAAGREVRKESVLDYLRTRLAHLQTDAPELPFDFTCGFAGYLGYELKADCGARPGHASPLPDAALVLCDRLIAFDHRERRVYLLALADPSGAEAAEGWLRATSERLRELACELPPLPPPSAPPGSLRFEPHDPPETYLANIAACRREILEGETYEVCLTTELRSKGSLDPLPAYRALRARNPAPFSALLRLGDLSVLSTSPERFLRVDRNRVVESRPMKGTAARVAEPFEDACRAAELRQDKKTRAENLMIADLVRNDLGRVSELGTVEVPGLMVVEPYATVHQMVTVVRGRLRDGADAIGCVRAAFPAGSMTGAPKLRTLEIIDRIEGRPRGVYSGALGFFSVNGTADLNVVIRTLVASPDGLTIGAGGAIVAGSNPEAELDEMLLKARPLLETVGGTLEAGRDLAAANR
jgi:para-aminobenzoate synthetase